MATGTLQHLFLVDQWQKQSGAYFLTHMHADHMKGLGSTWSRGPLYCSHITSRLLLVRFPKLSKTLLRPLEIGVSTMVEVWHNKKPELMEVTPIDAHHCPGSVMYLFRGSFGTRLHTGDFRWDAFLPIPSFPPTLPDASIGLGATQRDPENMETALPLSGLEQLQAVLQGRPVDLLVLDNTFCHPKYCFPKREEAVEQIWAILQAYPQHRVLIGVDSLGKENLLVTLATRLQTTIGVSVERFAIAKLLGLPDVFVVLPHPLVPNADEQPRVCAVPRKSVNLDHLRVLNAKAPTIGIVPSGWRSLDAPVSTFGAEHNGRMKGKEGAVRAERKDKNGESEKGSDEILFRVPNLADQHSPLQLLKSRPLRGAAALAGKNALLKLHEPRLPLPQEPLLFRVPYSLHSCFAELEAFVRLVKPRAIRSIAQKDPYGLNTCPNEHFRDLCEPSAQDQGFLNPQPGVEEVRVKEPGLCEQEMKLLEEACELRLLQKTKRAKPQRMRRAVRQFKRLRVGSASPPEKELGGVHTEGLCCEKEQIKGPQEGATTSCCQLTLLQESGSSQCTLHLAVAMESDGQCAYQSVMLDVRLPCNAADNGEHLKAAVPTGCQLATSSTVQLACALSEQVKVSIVSEEALLDQGLNAGGLLSKVMDPSGEAEIEQSNGDKLLEAANELPEWYLEAYNRWLV